jgi:hypothetical protein
MCSNGAKGIGAMPSVLSLADYKPGEIWYPTNGCVPNISGTQDGSGYVVALKNGFYYPNSEFEWGGLYGSCALCSFKYGYSDCSCTIGGKKPTMRRKAGVAGYSADGNICCLNMNSTEGNLTCDPKYRGGYNSPDCNSTYTAYCTNPKYMFSDKCNTFCAKNPALCNYANGCAVTGTGSSNDIVGSGICNSWCKNNPLLCNPKIIDYCTKNNNQNIQTDYCKNALRTIGGADAQVESWCATHVDDPFCACIHPKILYTGDDASLRALSNPRCFDQKCQISGYPTTNQRESCPTTLNVCGNTINMKDATASTVQNANQGCNINNSSSTSSSAPAAPAAPAQPNSKPTDIIIGGINFSQMSSLQYFGILAIFIFVLAIIFGIAIYDDDESDDSLQKVSET